MRRSRSSITTTTAGMETNQSNLIDFGSVPCNELVRATGGEGELCVDKLTWRSVVFNLVPDLLAAMKREHEATLVCVGVTVVLDALLSLGL